MNRTVDFGSVAMDLMAFSLRITATMSTGRKVGLRRDGEGTPRRYKRRGSISKGWILLWLDALGCTSPEAHVRV
jgi:hypothetical protein